MRPAPLALLSGLEGDCPAFGFTEHQSPPQEVNSHGSLPHDCAGTSTNRPTVQPATVAGWTVGRWVGRPATAGVYLHNLIAGCNGGHWPMGGDLRDLQTQQQGLPMVPAPGTPHCAPLLLNSPCSRETPALLGFQIAFQGSSGWTPGKSGQSRGHQDPEIDPGSSHFFSGFFPGIIF